MNYLNRALQLADRFVEAVSQLSFNNAIKVFSYLWGVDSLTHISLKDRRFYFHPRTDKGVLSHLYTEGYRILGDPEIIFDVGANIGDETLRFRMFHPNAIIVAIEASSRNFCLLEKNFQYDTKVVLIRGALWHTPGQLQLNASKGGSQESFSVLQAATLAPCEVVAAMSVPQILARHGLEGKTIDIFKIDVEGAERSIFCLGDNQWLQHVNVLIMEMPDNDLAGSFQLIVDQLTAFGIRGKSSICGENYVFIKEGSDYDLRRSIGIEN